MIGIVVRNRHDPQRIRRVTPLVPEAEPKDHACTMEQRHGRNIPILPAPGLGVGAIRIYIGVADATGFHNSAWESWKLCAPDRHKKARDADTFHVEGIRKPNQKMHRALAGSVLMDGTKQGLATFIPPIVKSS